MATARQLPPPSNPAANAPFVEWSHLYGYLKSGEFGQGDHVAVIGPTGSGKTHVALAIAELRAYVLLVACKPKDPLVSDAIAHGYWLVPGNKLEVPYVDDRPLHNRVVYWPRLPEDQARRLDQRELLAVEKAIQKPSVRGAIGYVRRNGGWCLVLDEGTWVCRDLNLQRDVDSALFQFRTLGASVVVLGQRPSWMGRYVLSSPTHLFLFSTNDKNDQKALGDIGGVDTKAVQSVVAALDFRRHECLYINTRTREMFRTIAPPR